MEFGERLRDLRLAKGMNQTQLAASAGVANTYISDVERGRRGLPTGEVLIKLAEALDTSADYLLGRTDDPAPLDSENATSLSPDERLRQLGAFLRGAGATEKDIETIMEVLELERRKNSKLEKLKRDRD